MSETEQSTKSRPTIGRLIGGAALALFGIMGAYGQLTKPASSSILEEAGRGPSNVIAILVGAAFVFAGVRVARLTFRGR